eukprot:1706327-Lingulodinium_polyedra.AAC.1
MDAAEGVVLSPGGEKTRRGARGAAEGVVLSPGGEAARRGSRVERGASQNGGGQRYATRNGGGGR